MFKQSLQALSKRTKSSIFTTTQRTYIAKHTHFHQWKKDKTTTPKQLETRAARQAKRILTTEQFERVKKPFDYPVITDPIAQRKTKQHIVLNELNHIELSRLKTLPRETVPFKVGDRIAVTSLLSMTEAKTQVYKGTVVSSKRGTGLYGRFTIRNGSDGGFYQISFPYWSPFLRKIEMIEPDPRPIIGKTKLGKYHRELPADHPKNRILV